MTEVAKIENVMIENFYRFSLKYKGKTYKNLSIEINNYKGEPKILWVNFDKNLERNEDFAEIEKKIFSSIRKRLKKQTKETNLSLIIKANGRPRPRNHKSFQFSW